jgi:hypothetical protein
MGETAIHMACVWLWLLPQHRTFGAPHKPLIRQEVPKVTCSTNLTFQPATRNRCAGCHSRTQRTHTSCTRTSPSRVLCVQRTDGVAGPTAWPNKSAVAVAAHPLYEQSMLSTSTVTTKQYLVCVKKNAPRSKHEGSHASGLFMYSSLRRVGARGPAATAPARARSSFIMAQTLQVQHSNLSQNRNRKHTNV